MYWYTELIMILRWCHISVNSHMLQYRQHGTEGAPHTHKGSAKTTKSGDPVLDDVTTSGAGTAYPRYVHVTVTATANVIKVEKRCIKRFQHQNFQVRIVK